MKRLSHLLLGIVVLLTMVSCPVNNEEGSALSIKATIEKVSTSKASIDESGKLYWSKGDSIAALLNNGKYVSLRLKNSDDGKTTGSFTGVIIGDDVELADDLHAYFPAQIAKDEDPDNVKLPYFYNMGNNVSNSYAMMRGEMGGSNLLFKHLGGVLVLNLGDVPAGACQLVFTVLDNKNITGDFALTAQTDDEENVTYIVAATAGDGARSSITMNFTALEQKSDLLVSIPLPIGSYRGIELEIKDEYEENLTETLHEENATFTIARAGRVRMPKVTFVEIVAGDETSVSKWNGTYPTDVTDEDHKTPASFIVDPSTKTITIKDAEAFAYLPYYNWEWDNITTRWWTWKVLLDCDIDLQNYPWTPINFGAILAANGSNEGRAYGEFDGQGHTIYNLNINLPSTDKVALFSANALKVSNLTVNKATVVGHDNVGVINAYTGSAENVTVRNINVSGNKFVGGITGKSVGGNYINCSVTGINNVINCTGKEVGGIVGFVTLNENGALSADTKYENCYVENTTITGGDEVGGIIGRAYTKQDNTTTLEINNCRTKNVTATSGTNKYFGPILGRNYANRSDLTVDGYKYYCAIDDATLSAGLQSSDFAQDAIIMVYPGTYAYVDVIHGGAKNNVHVIGAGEGVYSEGIQVELVHLGPLTNLYVENITFNGTTNGVNGLTVYAETDRPCDGVHVKNCTFNNEGAGFSVVGKAEMYANNIVAENCTFNMLGTFGDTGNTSAAYFQYINNLTIKNCVFERACHNAIQENYGSSGNIVITGNTFVNIKSRNVYLNGIKDTFTGTLTIDDNTFSLPNQPKEDGNYVKLGTKNTTLHINGSNRGAMDLSNNAYEYYYQGLVIE